MNYIGWIRCKRRATRQTPPGQVPPTQRYWLALTGPLTEAEAWERVRRSDLGDGGKVVLPEGQTPTASSGEG